MDDQYLDAFIRESEEAITELNNSLLDLESDPENTEAMEAIFRTAHTLKGNFGAMGFDDASDLAHAIEDLLDEMRDDHLEVTPEIMDLIFAGVDQIEAIVHEIDETGESTVDTDAIVADIRGVMDDSADGVSEATDKQTGEPSRDPEELLSGIELPDVDGPVYHASVSAGDAQMPGVDAMLTLESIEDALAILATDPSRDAIEDGDFEDAFDVFLAGAHRSAVEATLSAASKVEDATVTDVTDALEARAAGVDDGASSTETDSGAASSTGSGASAGTGSASSATADTADASDGEAGSVEEIKSVRVDVDQLDELHGLVEQLVTSRIKLRRAVEQERLDSASENLNELDKITANLQNTVMDMRLIPLKKVVGKFPRLVRDLSRDLGKEIDFTIEGEDIELDRTILTEISDPLMHILRNAVDHGIEPPEERERLGKSRTGEVTLSASRERDHVIIEVADDGSGLDVDAIKDQALDQGVRSPEEIEAMTDSDLYDLIFHPGFSTADEVTDTSGRGVGMDVVHETVTKLDGSVNVESTPGEGTTVSLRLPVTMAIVKVLFVQVGDEQYGVPIKNVDEITRATKAQTINGTEVIKHNDEIYPVVDIAKTFDVPGETKNGDGMLVRIRESERRIALHCDSVESQEEVVVKPLEGILSGTPGLSGTAVLGDGNIVHILDVVTL
ncbi:chemotaxis protein CheA [Halapricum hydrolyticum]|uniref:Chemotaxis protein CheA n=1 Tax=Halapricum hydrolyticum TaxID=2979991 RepID=A0AAE3I912_9EURY|nr:chemotaxis protein CheA [Halapricum hydrolyticum]MCU4717131.1 chemotaxis protein CheA [Halapricum hydrolyticum]MCU4726058.1 chemotaxis protein CheA [Halapricum hydrolyticum]